MGQLSKSQIDKLGERLRGNAPQSADVRQLEEFRRSFVPAFSEVTLILRSHGIEFLERAAKSTPSIIAKLKRGSMKLSRIQDIAGCRILVKNRNDQDWTVELLRAAFPTAIVKDRREKPNHGYRAVHVIPLVAGKYVEIQIRTRLQHLWAAVSEKAFDVIDPEIKYGGGPQALKYFFAKSSDEVAEFEVMESEHSRMSLTQIAAARDEWELRSVEISRRRDSIVLALTNMLSSLESRKGLKELS
ncbi:MAG TPA: hypothetical protein VGN88_00775 [Phycisphaerae bacterium]|jgi:ppGpp synthetase/RelA/SpoT-type nucleotidyltranferase